MPSHKAGRFTVTFLSGFYENYSSGYCYRFARYSLLCITTRCKPIFCKGKLYFWTNLRACL